jgi:hypothetical protein
MAVALDVRQKQSSVIQFLCCENATAGNIHKRLQNVHGDDAVNRSTVSRWARRLSGESVHINNWDSPRSGRPHTAQTSDNVQRVNDVILGDRHVTVKEMTVKLRIGKASACRILKLIGVEKMFVQGGFQGC